MRDMNWKKQLFKPKWQHKDPSVRAAAVASDPDPELLIALGGICLEDDDTRVRMAAARRLDDLPALLKARHSEEDPAVLSGLNQRITALATSKAASRPPLEHRLGVLGESSDRELAEAIAASAPEAELRQAALVLIDRQGFLGDRAIADPDPATRRLAAAKISQQSTLKRVIDSIRTSDKSLHQELKERLHLERLADGHPEAVEHEALGICQSLEQFSIHSKQADPREINRLREAWTALGNGPTAVYLQRFERAIYRLAGGKQDPDEGTAVAGVSSTTDERLAEEPAKSDRQDVGMPAATPGLMILLERMKAYRSAERMSPRKVSQLQKDWGRAWSGIRDPGEADLAVQESATRVLRTLHSALEERTRAQGQQFNNLDGLLNRLEAELKEGELHKALLTRSEIQKTGKEVVHDRRWKAVQQALNRHQVRLRELREWQHWSNDKIRKRLILEMTALPASGLHPDAVLARIKELRANWKELEQSEQIPGDRHYAAAPSMWRKFNAAGRAAFEATKPFLDKRSEIRKRHLGEMKQLCRRMEAMIAEDQPDWPKLKSAIAKAGRELRALDEIPARSRHQMARRLKQTLDKANAVMQSNYAEIEKHKLKLVRAAAQLTHHTDRDEAIRQAKALQSEWKAAGQLWRSREQKLWKLFRESIDPLFKQLKAAQESQREEYREHLEAQKQLCDSLGDLLKLEDDALNQQQGKIRGLQDSWRDIPHPDKRLQRQFQRDLETFQARIKAYQRRVKQATRQRWWQKAELLHEAETAARKPAPDKAKMVSLCEQWPETSCPEQMDDWLDARRDALMENDDKALPPSQDQGVIEQKARTLCIQLEFLAGLPSPKADRDHRMKYQVDRLSDSLSKSGDRLPALEETHRAETEWLTLPWLSRRKYLAFRKRIQAALDEIYQE